MGGNARFENGHAATMLLSGVAGALFQPNVSGLDANTGGLSAMACCTHVAAFSKSVRVHLQARSWMGGNARFKNGHARVETRVLKTPACRNGFWTSFKQW